MIWQGLMLGKPLAVQRQAASVLILLGGTNPPVTAAVFAPDLLVV
jgi:hypothetical protein